MSRLSHKVRRAKARKIALWMLYGLDLNPELFVEERLFQAYELLCEQEEDLPDLWEEVELRVLQVWSARERLNDEIQQVSPRWRLDRMATIDRNILRMGIWEILEQVDSPIVVVNDCIELAKRYGGKGTPAFINGLLDQVCKNHNIPMKLGSVAS